MNLADYNRLKDKAEQLQRDYDRTQGTLDAIKARLKQEFTVSLERSGKLLMKLGRQIDKADAEYEKAKGEFEAKWKERLG